MTPVLSPEVDVGGQRYKLSPIATRDQFHIVRYLGPFQAVRLAVGQGQAGLVDLAHAFAHMPKDQVDWILDVSLASIQRYDSGKWVPIMSTRGVCQYADINAAQQMVLMRQAVGVFSDDFFETLVAALGLQSNSDTTPAAPPAN